MSGCPRSGCHCPPREHKLENHNLGKTVHREKCQNALLNVSATTNIANIYIYMCKYILYIDFTQSRRYCLQLALNNTHIRVKGPLATQKDIAYDKRVKPGNIILSLLAYVLCEKNVHCHWMRWSHTLPLFSQVKSAKEATRVTGSLNKVSHAWRCKASSVLLLLVLDV